MNRSSSTPPWDDTLRQAMHAQADRDYERAVTLYRELLHQYPFLSRAAYNLGNIYKETGQYETAEVCFRQALAAEPDLFEAAQNLAFTLQEQGKLSEAAQLYQQIVLRWPGLPDPRFSLACLQLLRGDLANGWAGYESRFECLVNPVPRRHSDLPRWDGDPAQPLRLLLHTEQGFGDTLQMSRYLPLLAATGISTILETDAALAPLFARSAQLTDCIIRGCSLPSVDAQLPLMSLPGLFRTSLETIPPPALPEPDPALVAQFDRQLPKQTALRIGLCWSGRLDLPVNRKRSCPVEQVRRLLAAPDCCFISLQTTAAPEFNLTDPRLLDLTAALHDFHATAALIASLDLVISIDTAVAHLAGSMGKPVWLLVPFVPDWRWLLERDDSPWYPSMRLFRQPSRGAWEQVIGTVLAELTFLGNAPAEALTNKGALLGEHGRHTEALRCYNEALLYRSDIAVTQYNRGNSLSALGCIQEARNAWHRALQLNPRLVEAWHNLAISHRDQGDCKTAHTLLLQALQLRPNDPELQHTRGELFQAEERFEEAIAAFRQSLAVRPGSARTWNSLGTVYQSLEQDPAAEQCYRAALAHDPRHLHARNNLGAVLLSQGRAEEAIPELELLIASHPDYYDGHWNLACALLAAGHWAQGWQAFEYRFLKHSPVEERHQEIPRWDGHRPLADKTVLLVGEQAFGDTLQFVRFIPQLAARGARVILECQAPPLVPLMQGQAGLTDVICRGDAVPPADYRIPLLSLPLLLQTPAETLADLVPYLTPSQDKREQWRIRLADDTRLRVGLCWWGRQTLRNRRRSCPPDLLAPLAALSGISLYRLQLGDDVPAPPFSLVDHTGLIADFSDTAALISCLDLVITIDTAVAHLAGALGVPVWLMLPLTGDWRWMSEREDSPWYPGMRIFRQGTAGDWQPVVEKMADTLRPLAEPKIYLYRPRHDFPPSPHLGQRLVPLLETVDTPASALSVRLSPDPAQADLLLFPYYLENLTEWHTIEGVWQFLEALPLFREREEQHLFFSDHDSAVPYHSSAWWFRASIAHNERDSHSLALPYQTDDLHDYLHFDLQRLRYHASFVGYLGVRKQRARLLESFSRTTHLNVLIEPTEAFHGHQTPDKRAERRQHFLDICAESLCILCPAGDGTNSIRFFEALSLGRLPVLLSDCPLPFEDRIPYHRFVCRILPHQAEQAGELLLSWLTMLGDEDVIQRCREARQTWEDWFAPDILPARLWQGLLRARCRALAPAQTRQPSTPPPAAETAAVAIAQATVAQSPRSPRAYLQLGQAYVACGDNDRAAAAFLRAIGYDHRCFEAYLELGRCLAGTDRDQAAVERFYEASLVRPDDPAPYREALACLERLGRETEAAHCRCQLERLPPQPPVTPAEALMQQGDLLREQEQWQQALACYQQALEVLPDQYDALLRAGGCLILQNRHHEAKAYLRRAIALQPDSPDPHINLAICHFALGAWQEGWHEFEWRRRYISEALPAIAELPPLRPGQRLDGASVLVHCEQGFGDMLQFCRYLPLLCRLGARVVFSVPPELMRLCHSLGSGITPIPHGEILPQTDYQTLLMSLPGLLQALQPGPLAREAYLAAPAACLETAHALTDTLPGIRIGLAWQGRNLGKSGYRRSLDPELLQPLLELPGCSFVSLHPQPVQPAHPRILDLSNHLRDFADTAALMAQLDLVITVDTAVAHLAGALGIPCWVALLYAPDWRWFPLDTSSSPWYPSLRFFRQPTPGDWQEVITRLVNALQEELDTRSGHALLAEGREQEALDCFRAAASHQEASAAAWLNLGTLLHRQGATEEGRTALQQALRRDPTYPEAWQNLGLLQQALGEYSEAYCCFRQALRLRPDYPTARWNLALLQLLLGDYRNGLQNYEARFDKQPPIPRLHQELPPWDGSGSLRGKTLLVHAEQGYGDTIQFCRYLPILEKAGAELVLEVQDQRLVALICSLPCHVTVAARGERLPEASLQVPLLSLPRLLETTPETIPAAVPYLFADTDKLDAWRHRLSAVPQLKVGLVWQGSPKHLNDRVRSCPPQHLTPLAELPGIAWYLLQPDLQGRELPFAMADLTAALHDFSDTAALLTQLDLVITVDTAVAHLAGALGRPTWLLLASAPDWRWGINSETSAWYPGMRIFRQGVPGDWGGPLARIRAELAELAAWHADRSVDR